MPPAEGSVPLLGVASRPTRIDADKSDLGHGFSFVIVFPLPEVTTSEDEVAFKKHLRPGQTYKDVLESCVVRDGRERAEECSSNDCDNNLEGLRTATIELFHSLFRSLIETHSESPDDDSDVFLFTSVDKDELFMCVKMSDAVVEHMADMTEYPVQLNKDCLKNLNILLSGDALKKLVPAYVKFDAFQKDSDFLVKYDKGMNSHDVTVLPQKDRIRLIYDRIITYVDLQELKRLGLVLHTYAGHTDRINEDLREEWANLALVYTCAQPLDKVREYFGEEIAFYFLFVQRLGISEKFLIAIALISHFSSAWWPEDEISRRYKDMPKVVYSFCLMFWFFAFLKHWRRTETHCANSWGVDRVMAATTLRQPVNPGFEGIYVGSPVDEHRMVLVPIKWKRKLGLVLAVLIEFSFYVLVIVVLTGLQAKYTNLANCENPETPPCNEDEKTFLGINLGDKGGKIVSALLSVTIKVFNYVWTPVAEWLCDAEQHVYLVDWNAARTGKIFRFTFISTFFAFFVLSMLPVIADSPWLAKAWGWNDQESDAAIMKNSQDALTQSLMINFLLYVSFGILDMIIPWGTLKWRIRSERLEMEKSGKESFKLSSLEEQAKMLEYTGADAADDYMAIIFPLGFVILFSQGMPLFSACLSFLVVSTQIRADAWKFVCAYRRPFPEMVSGIRNWNEFLEAFAWFGIVLNALQFTTVCQIEDMVKSIFPFFAEHYEKDSGLMEYVEFFLYCMVCLLMKLLLEKVIGDVDSHTILERRRQEWQRIRLYNAEEDFKEKVVLRFTGNNAVKQWGREKRLKPGDPKYVGAMT